MTVDFRLEQHVEAPLARAWEACASARGLARWQADSVSGEIGRGRHLELGWPQLGTSLPITVTSLIEREEITFDSGGSRVHLLFTPGQVALEHEGLEAGDDVEGVASSWRLSLALLAHSVERHPDRDRQVVWMLERARTTAEAAHVFFSDSAALGTWLGRGNGIGKAGSAVALDCPWGDHIEGTVLANTPSRDIALSWPGDENAVLCLRTLPSPRSREERLLLVYWSRWSKGQPPAVRRRGLASALGRLARSLDRSADA